MRDIDIHAWSEGALRRKLDEIAHFELRGVSTFSDAEMAADIRRELARREFAAKQPTTLEQWAKGRSSP